MTHKDCRNLAPVDVFKGICHRTKQLIPLDGEACQEFVRMPRCGFCAKYEEQGRDYEGACTAEDHRPMTYPDLAAVTCKWFEWKN